VWSLVLPEQTVLVSSRTFSPAPRKTAFINSCKNLSTIQRSDQELMTCRVGTIVWSEETPPAYLDDFVATPRKQAF